MKILSSRPPRVTFVYEYGQLNSDWMLSSLIRDMELKLPGLQVTRVHGLFAKFRVGGLHYERIVNLAWVYLRVVLHLLFARPDAVLVRSTPPCVQLWTVWWARFRRVPVFCWLMDYHPEMEARQLERRGFARSARFLRHIDAGLMPRFATIIALDKAMADFVRTRAVNVEILQHPTWTMSGADALRPVSYLPGGGTGPLRLAYSGNLGAAHDLSALTGLLSELAGRRPVQLYIIGASPAGEERFKVLGASLGIPIVTNPRVSFTVLRELYEQWKIDAGVVLLSAESAGLVSPSKFSGYINFGIPLVYLGPPDTNTAEICTRFGGGFWVPVGARKAEIENVAESLLEVRRMLAAASGARAAAAHFSSLTSDSLAEMLATRIRRTRPVAAMDPVRSPK